MDIKKYRRLRIIIIFFIGAVIGWGISTDNILLALAGFLTGLLFLTIVRSKVKLNIDEREKTVREKAAQMTYAIFAPTLGIGAFLMLIPSHSNLSVFAKGDFLYLESLAIIFAYLSLFLIALYAVSYRYFNKKFGGGNEE